MFVGEHIVYIICCGALLPPGPAWVSACDSSGPGCERWRRQSRPPWPAQTSQRSRRACCCPAVRRHRCCPPSYKFGGPMRYDNEKQACCFERGLNPTTFRPCPAIVLTNYSWAVAESSHCNKRIEKHLLRFIGNWSICFRLIYCRCIPCVQLLLLLCQQSSVK